MKCFGCESVLDGHFSVVQVSGSRVRAKYREGVSAREAVATAHTCARAACRVAAWGVLGSGPVPGDVSGERWDDVSG